MPKESEAKIINVIISFDNVKKSYHGNWNHLEMILAGKEFRMKEYSKSYLGDIILIAFFSIDFLFVLT